jgi:hypothetical protein
MFVVVGFIGCLICALCLTYLVLHLFVVKYVVWEKSLKAIKKCFVVEIALLEKAGLVNLEEIHEDPIVIHEAVLVFKEHSMSDIIQVSRVYCGDPEEVAPKVGLQTFEAPMPNTSVYLNK